MLVREDMCTLRRRAGSLGLIGLGTEALDPTWTAQVARGQFIVDAPVCCARATVRDRRLLAGAGLWLRTAMFFGDAA